jgi:hypothetical protein
VRKKKNELEAPRPRKPLRLMSQVHLENLERPYLCGCPDCLRTAGLEMVTVFDPHTHKWRAMLVNWFSVSGTQVAPRENLEPDSEENPDAEA